MTELQVLEETIYRQRRLNGVLDCALGLAATALHESVGGGLLVSEWHERLIQEAVKTLKGEGVFEGRWILFSDDELEATLRSMTLTELPSASTEEADKIMREIRDEIERRQTTPAV